MAEDAARMYRLRLEASDPAAGRIARALDEAETPAALSVSFFDLGNARFEVSALYEGRPSEDDLRALVDQAASSEAIAPLAVEALPDIDWVTLSQGQRGPVSAGRFLVYGAHDRDKLVQTRFAIEIDAGQAFGTAHHATTRGCLMAIDRLARSWRPGLVLDVGTGTGILALAAAIAFGQTVVATDNDPVAVDIARENVRKTGLQSHVHVVAAEGLRDASLRRLGPDLVLANILEGPLHSLAPAMARTLQPGGKAVLSGITSSQAGALIGRYSALGFVLERRILLDGWATLLLGRRYPNVLSD